MLVRYCYPIARTGRRHGAAGILDPRICAYVDMALRLQRDQRLADDRAAKIMFDRQFAFDRDAIADRVAS